MTGIGVPVMFATMFIHPVVAMIAMVGVMYAAMLFMTGSTVFTMDSKGIHRTISTSLKWGKKEPKTETQTWDHLKWFKEGKDRGKYSAEFHFLRLHFKNGAEWMITDNDGERLGAFLVFLANFKQIVAEHNQHIVPANSSVGTAASVAHRPEEKIIEQRKTFYETVWAKIFTIFLGAVIVVFLFLWATTPYVNSIAAFRLFFVLIPGFVYMWYRVFGKKK